MNNITTDMLERAGCQILPSLTYGISILFAYDVSGRLFASSVNNGSSWNLRKSSTPFRFKVKYLVIA
jgi:hypothetical protein